MYKIIPLILIILAQQLSASGQSKKKSKNPVAAAAPPAGGNPNPVDKPSQPSDLKPYKEIITDKAKTDDGLFKVHNIAERYFFEIPDSLIGRDILVVNRIGKGAAGVRAAMMGYAGDQIGDNVIRFEKGPVNRIFLKSISFKEKSSDTTGMYTSVLNSSVQPIMAAFDVKTEGKDSISGQKTYVIDVHDYLNSDNEIFFFNPWVKNMLSLANILGDRSYISQIRSYKGNIEIRTVKTYMKNAPQFPGAPPLPPSPVTFELNSSIVLLPKVPMKARYFDPRVGYFATGYTDFDANPHGVKEIAMITRWRLEPKPGDEEKYKRGELVEPAKPIVFYIDPATPKKWVPYLIQGVNDWQAAFEKAGFKNAIIAKEAPKDADWSIDDASHNAIVYKPSDIPNASGPHVHDPRSGEIIETHINWYHNIMTLVRNWYMVQAAATDPKARTLKFDDDLMGQLIRFVSSHEVGHTLGLRHNFGSSSTVPVENLRNKNWLEQHGHTPSIMDYARFNYVAQPEDNIPQKSLFPRIGEYDEWAIEWGYKWMPDYKTAAEESLAMGKMIVDRTAADKQLWFGTEMDADDPRSQNEDLGDNAMLASSYGIKNLKRILPHIVEWTKEPNDGYENAGNMYNEVLNQYGQYMRHVRKNIAGIYNTPKSVEEKGAVYVQVPAQKQREAMKFLNSQLFTTPYWLVDKNISSLTGTDPVNMIRNVQTSTLNNLQSPFTILKLIKAEALNGSNAYTALNLFADLKAGIWSELGTAKPIDVYRRNLQKAYIDNLSKLVNPPPANQQGPGGPAFNPTTSDVSSIARAHLINLKNDIRKSLPAAKGISRYHLIDLSARIESILDINS